MIPIPSPLDEAVKAAIGAADPFSAVASLASDPRIDDADVVIAVGKASAVMALALQARGFSGRGLLITAAFDATPLPTNLSNWTHIKAGHPVPDKGSLEAGEAALALAKAMESGQRLLVLLSGGASAMLEAPVQEIDLTDIQALNRALLASGLDIVTMNRLRTRLSRVKGGQLAIAAFPASTHALIVSDIPGDIAAFVGSGPTLPPPNDSDGSDLSKLISALDVSERLTSLLTLSAQPTPILNRFEQSTSQTIVTAKHSLNAAAQVLERTGYRVMRLGDEIEADANVLGTDHGGLALGLALQNEKVALLSGGETSVRVRTGGRGGRNKAYLLAAAISLQGAPNVRGIAMDSDGIDGSEDDAGAWFDSGTLETIVSSGKLPEVLMAHSLSYDAFAISRQLVITGPTGTNINDLRILLIN